MTRFPIPPSAIGTHTNFTRTLSRDDSSSLTRSVDPVAFPRRRIWRDDTFLYFSDVGDDKLKEAVRKGRFEFLSQFPSTAAAEMQTRSPCLTKSKPLRRSKLDWNEREKNHALFHLHRDLIKLRREDSRLRQQSKGRSMVPCSARKSFLLRFSMRNRRSTFDCQFRSDATELMPVPEPLLAPPCRLRMGDYSGRANRSATVDREQSISRRMRMDFASGSRFSFAPATLHNRAEPKRR